MNILIIDSGIVEHKELNLSNVFVTGFRSQTEMKDVLDSTGHGTAIAGLIVKGNENVNIFVLKLFNEEYECKIEDLIEALEYVIKNNHFQIINMSFGITTFENPCHIRTLEDLCKKLTAQGSILVAAFDNDGAISYPACFKTVIGVDCSNIARKKDEYEYIENSIVNIKAYGRNQKVAWNDPIYTILGGCSFACANLSNILIRILEQTKGRGTDVLCELKKRALHTVVFEKQQPLSEGPSWLSRGRAIILPFNKEIHSLIAYERQLLFSISGVYDFKYTAQIGIDTSSILTYSTTYSHLINNYETIDWDSDKFDMVVAGHLSEISWRCKRDLLGEIIENCCKYGKKLYSFDSLDTYQNLIQQSGAPLNYFFSPKVGEKHIPKGRFGKLYEIVSPVLAIIGTSSRQGKFTLQLDLRERFIKKGYRVGQLGSEPSALCYGMDQVFPYGYQSTVETGGYENIILLNQIMHEMDIKGVDISIVGTQSGTVAYSSENLMNIPLHQIEFLMGTNPDGFVICVNPFDELDYIQRTLRGVEAYCDSQCIAIVVYPLSQQQLLGSLYKKTNITQTEQYRRFKESLQSITDIRVFDMEEALSSDQLLEEIIDFFAG